MRWKRLKSLSWLVVAATVTLPTDADAQTVRIVALGDSNTAGFLVGKRNAFPAIIETSLRAAGYDVTVSNQGISGDTTSGMLSRLDFAVPRGVKLAIVQGRYNDQRRGVSAQTTDANIDTILTRRSARRIKVILCGFSGAQWGNIARRHHAVLVLGSTCYDAGNRGFDGLHMNKAGHKVVATRLIPVISRFLGRR